VTTFGFTVKPRIIARLVSVKNHVPKNPVHCCGVSIPHLCEAEEDHLADGSPPSSAGRWNPQWTREKNATPRRESAASRIQKNLKKILKNFKILKQSEGFSFFLIIFCDFASLSCAGVVSTLRAAQVNPAPPPTHHWETHSSLVFVMVPWKPHASGA